MITAGRKTIGCEIYKLLISTWNKEGMLEEWQESITVPMKKESNIRDCSNYKGTTLLPTVYKNLSVILL